MVLGIDMVMVSIRLDDHAVVLFVVVDALVGVVMSPASGFTSRLVPFKLL